MNSTSPYFDSTAIDTPDGLAVARATTAIPVVPVTGTGLLGEAYAPGTRINSIDDLRDIIAAQAADAEFRGTELVYGARDSDTTIAEFLGDDAASLTGNGDLEMGPSGLVFTGFVYIPPGVHEVAITSDDGFDLKLGGVDFATYEGARAVETTGRVAEFEGGLYEVELLYFDQGGKMDLVFEIDGLPVDQSAFYASVAEFDAAVAAGPTVDAEDYHPSYFIGEEVVDTDDDPSFTPNADQETGDAGNDLFDALEGDDIVGGGYGNDKIEGSDGDDVLDGGRGMDFLIGGAGNDIIVSRSDAGEQRIGQLAIGASDPAPDPDGEVNEARQKLAGWESMPLKSDDFLMGGEGNDVFLFAPQINAKLDIIEKHVRSDGTINWAGVAGENDEIHDHWVDAWGIDTILDYVAGEDQIAVIGHTAEVCEVEYRDTNGDGVMETIITVHSNQSGPCVRTGQPHCSCIQDGAAGGAHDRDLLGQIIVFGDLVDEDDIIVDAGVTYGIVESYADVAEALFPQGETKVTVVNGDLDVGGAITDVNENGETVIIGYDTRGPDGSWGPIMSNPENFIDNPFMDEAMALVNGPETAAEESGDPMDGLIADTGSDPLPPTRAPFEPLPIVELTGETVTGGAGDDLLTPTEAAETLPAPISTWDFGNGTDGAFADAKGGPTAKMYTLYENQAWINTAAVTEGPGGEDDALYFDGESNFAFIQHDPRFQVTQGTIAFWARPDDLSDFSMMVSKDQVNTGDGGHFRLGHTDDGGLFLRMAPGDGDANREWKTGPILTEGEWVHLAVSFTAAGVVVYRDGVAIDDGAWQEVNGGVATPGQYREAFFVANQEPWALGADQHKTEINDTAQVFGTDDEDLRNPFEGALAQFTIYGGYEAADALTADEVATVAQIGFDPASIPDGPAPGIVSSADLMNGNAGDDTIEGGGGDDTLNGGMGNDSILGEYGDDLLDGGAGNDTLDGGRGSDLLMGGDGDDVLRARSDAGEDRAAQMFLDTGNQRDPLYIDPVYNKLNDWLDQPIVADDILVGGEGSDHFQIELQINGTMDAILDNLMDGGRMIHWHGVAGENRYVHEHWVDSIGIDVIADFNADEDRISVIGHTVNIEIHYVSNDADGDGVADSIVSVITAYSQQGNGGGAHDEDYLGYVVVHGDMVTEDMVETDAGAHYGIVRTVDELQEAFAPTGETKTRDYDGQELFGYDSRDVEGDPIGSNPGAFSENPYADLVTFDDETLADQAPLTVVYQGAGGTFSGAEGDYGTVAHPAGSEAQLVEGTVVFSFTADTPGEGKQTILSKDHSSNEAGGHFTAWVNDRSQLEIRFQDAQAESNSSRYLKYTDEKIQAGQTYNVAFSFSQDALLLYVNGQLVDADDGFPSGMSANIHEWLVGASAIHRQGDDDNARDFFDGTVEDFYVLDGPLTALQGLLLGEADGDVAAITSGIVPQADDTAEEEDDTTEEGDDTAEEGDDTTEEEDGTAEEGDDTAEEGDGTTEEDDDTTEEEDGTTEEEDDTAEEDDDTAEEEEDDTAEEGDDTTEEGDGTTEEEDDTTEEEDDTTEEEDGTTEEGDDTTEEGDDTAEEEDTTEEEDDTTEEEDGTTEEEDDTAEEEDGTTEEEDAPVVLIEGDDSDERLRGTAAAEMVLAGGGTDRISAGGGDDTVMAGEGDDRVNGQAGDDEVVGDVGEDTLRGQDGDDTLDGGQDDDTVAGGDGDDVASGGDGDDKVRGGEGDDTLSGDAGEDTVSGGEGDDSLSGGADDDTVSGGEGDDTLEGDAGDDKLRGGDGEDSLVGGEGNDTLVGGDGDDRLEGGLDIDKLRGGDGEDEFFFDQFGAENADRIVDFRVGEDKVVLDAAVFEELAQGALDAQFVVASAAESATDRLIYDDTTGVLSYDVDGLGGAEAEEIATLKRRLDLTADDFIVE